MIDMKKIPRLLLLLFCSAFIGSSLFAQNLDFNLRYDIEMDRYEVYVRPDASDIDFQVNNARITVVTPALGNTSLMINDVLLDWASTSSVNAPAAAPDNDFFDVVVSSGEQINLVANQEALLFYFSLDGGCVDGVRLFENSTDPGPTESGMIGNDYSNSISAIGNEGPGEYYDANYDNNGTSCSVASLPVLGYKWKLLLGLLLIASSIFGYSRFR